jgi:hypothetical protein
MSGAQTIAVPASVAANDILFIAIYREATADSPTVTGFTALTSVSTSNHKVSFLWKRATGSDAGTYAITLNGTAAWTTAACLRISGCITSGSPWDTGTGAPTTALNNTTTSTTPDVSLTTTAVDTLLVYAGSNASGGAWTPPTSMTERTDTGDDLTTATLAQASATGTGNKAATLVTVPGTSTSFLGALLSVAAGTSASAENAAGTGTANAASIAIGVNAGNATGTGAANDATAAAGVNAEAASGTGTAYNATVSTVPGTQAPAGVATGTGTANAASIAIGVLAEAATGTGTAYNTPTFDFPRVPLGLIVEMAPGADPLDDPDDWPWVDITEYVMRRGSEVAVRITRGATSETSNAPVPKCSFELNNRDGAFSTQNYLSPYWPDLIKGTPVRVRIDDGPIQGVRFVGRMDELPPRWDMSGNDRWVPVTASGIQRRLNKGVKPADPTSGVTVPPPITSASRAAADCVASWPCTDTAGNSADEVVADDAELGRNDSSLLIWSTVTGPDGVTKLPSFILGGVLSGAVPGYTTSSEWTAEADALIDDRAPTTALVPLSVSTTGTATDFQLELDETGSVNVLWTNPGGTTATALSVLWPARDNAWHTWSLRAAQSGGDIDVEVYVDQVLIGSGTITSQTVGDLDRFQLGDGQANAGIVSMGYARVFRSSTPTVAAAAIAEAVAGYTTETADVRFARLATGGGIPVEVFGTSDQLMGPQGDSNLAAQLAECAAVDAGMQSESREGRAALYCRSLKENAASVMTLDLSAGEFAGLPEPDDSHALTVNSQTVTLASDSSVTATVTDDAHIARYELYEGGAFSINAASGSQVAPHAGLKVWLGTYEGYRYPRVGIALHRNPSLAATAVDLDFHQRITLTGIDEPPGDDIDVLLIGCTEEIGAQWWMQNWVTTMYPRWAVGVIVATPTASDAGGWIVPDSLVLAEDLDVSETAVDVTSVPVLPTGAAHYPTTIQVGAEQMTVSACAGAGPTQTLTVTRAANGSPAMTHTTGDEGDIVSAVVMTL